MKKSLLLPLLFLIFISPVWTKAAQKYSVKTVLGISKVLLPGDTTTQTIKRGDAIPAGSVITTGLNSRVILDFGDSVGVFVFSNTKVELNEAMSDTSGVKIFSRIKYGKMRNKIKKGVKVKSFKIVTPVSTAGVRGTDFALNVDYAGLSSEVYVFSGVVRFSNNKFPTAFQLVKPNEKAYTQISSSIIKKRTLSPEDYKIFGEKLPLSNRTSGTSKSTVSESTARQPESAASTAVSQPKTKTAHAGHKSIKSFNAQIGARTIDGEVYYLLQLQPEFRFGKWGVGLDLNINYNDRGIRKADWNEPKDFLNIINYISYGAKGEHIYARLGTLNYTLGHGFIIRNYINNIGESYQKKLGLNFDYSAKSWGIESIVNDLTRFNLVGLRYHLLPFANAHIPLFSKLGIGASAVIDFKEKSGANGDTQLRVIGLDAELPLFRFSKISLLAYSDIAKMQEVSQGNTTDHGYGIALPGVMFRFFNIFNFFAEYRILNKDFIPSVVGTMYEVNKPKFSGKTGRTRGFYSEGQLSLFNIISGNIQYENYQNRSATLSSTVKIVNNKILPQLKRLEFTYYQSNIKSLFDLKNKNAAIIGEIAWAISGPVDLVYKYKYTFNDQGKAIRSMSVSTELDMW